MEHDVEVIAKNLMVRAPVMADASKLDETDMFHPEVDSFVRKMLSSCSQLMFTCASLATGPHELSVNILARAIIEMVIKSHWATMSEGNAVLLQNTIKEQHINDAQSFSAQTSLETLSCFYMFSHLLGNIGARWLIHRSRPDNKEIRGLLGLDSDVQP